MHKSSSMLMRRISAVMTLLPGDGREYKGDTVNTEDDTTQGDHAEYNPFRDCHGRAYLQPDEIGKQRSMIYHHRKKTE